MLITMLVAPLVVVTVTVEAVRTRRLELDGGGVADDIPEHFYGSSFLPAAVLDNVGWVIAAGVLWIVAAALLMGRSALAARVQETKAGW
ncbi:hypothetical protein [Brachybacterium sp. FME24]|uniref:hypothetical protein n=1 Tax=Brachybacterium sp. FME24 TaxID=2742605 RepID=UPI001866385F|nr:hypothetical protein [Brachybacterium sp. FME24]